MEILKKIIFIVLLFLPNVAESCPSCAAANNGRFFLQSLIAVGVMWLLPVVISLFIGIKIYRMCHLENAELPKGGA